MTEATLKVLESRGINKATMEKYGTKTVVLDGDPIEMVYTYPNGAIKHRNLTKKDFYSEGPMKDATLFGADKFSPGSARSITITEGENDAMSVYQMLGSKYPAVSVRSSGQARVDCEREFKYLDSFERIYLCLDNDEQGKKATLEVAYLFDPNKVYIVELGNGNKDANDYLAKGMAEEFTRVWWNAKRFLPKNIVNDYQSIKEILSKQSATAAATYPFPTLQDMTYGIRLGEVVLFTALEKVGKALSLDTIVPTPKGWTSVECLEVGDKLFTRNGKETTITFITEPHERDYYKITFSDGTSIEASDHHRWTIRNLSGNEVIKTTKEMLDEGVLRGNKVAKFMVPQHPGVDYQEASLPIDPFLLGVWLADGHAYSANITLSSAKLSQCDQSTVEHKEKNSENSFTVRFNQLKHSQLSELHLLKNKHIPLQYMQSSRKQREQLFKGLMFDGWANKEFYSSDERLFNQVVELARSLGYIVFTRSRQGRYKNKDGVYVECKKAYSFRYRTSKYKAIRSIEAIGTKIGKCLTVDDPSHLFIVGDGWTLTHNTEIIRAIEHHLIKTTDDNVGIIHLEEGEKRSIEGLCSYELDVPCHLPDSGVSLDDKLKAYQELTKRDSRVHYYTHFGSDDPNTILSHIRYMVSVLKCKYIFLDHITMLVTGHESDDERRTLDHISTRLAMMTRELNFCLFLVSHVNDNGQTRGSRNISKIADLIISLNRDPEAPTFDARNTTELIIKGNRFAAHSGPAGYLKFDPHKYQISEITLENATTVEPF